MSTWKVVTTWCDNSFRFCGGESRTYIRLNDCLIQAVRIEHCERVHLITAAKRICIANCRECLFFLGVNQKPLIVGDNHKLQVSLT